MRKDIKRLLLSAGLFFVLYASIRLYGRLSGISLVLFVATHLTLFLILLFVLIEPFLNTPRFQKFFKLFGFLWAAFWISMVIAEVLMIVLAFVKPEHQVQMPDHLKKRKVEVPGTIDSYFWQGKLHVHNADGFRTSGTYRMDPSVFRIMVLGDSLTYGYAVASEDSYPAIIEKQLSKSIPVKVYNLGKSGFQSEDILGVARKWVPVLRPHVTLYGVCLNDFLPSRTRQYQSNQKYQLPIPRLIKRPLEQKTRTGPLLARGYDQLLLQLKWRNDFFDDILEDFRGYQTRFRQDLVLINRFVSEQTGHPALLIVLNAIPADARARRIADTAEEAGKNAGMQVAEMKKFYERFSERHTQLHVNRWDTHPNETAHKGFAEILLPYIENDPLYVQYKDAQTKRN